MTYSPRPTTDALFPMSVLVALASLLLLPGFTIAAGVGTECTSATDWSWSFNTLKQSPCGILTILISTCSSTANSIYPSMTELELCKCTTVMYSLLSACSGCSSEDWPTWVSWSSSCATVPPASWFPKPVPGQTRLPQWSLNDITHQEKWNATRAKEIGGLPEVLPGESIDNSRIPPGLRKGDGHTPPSSTATGTSPTSPPTSKKKANIAVIAGAAGAGVVFMTIAGAVFFYCRRRRRVQGPPKGSTVNDDSRALYRESIVSGASQAQSVGSPVNGESLMSYSGSGSMGGMQASPIVSGLYTTSQEPLPSPSSASAVHGVSQPHIGEDPQSVPNYVTILQPLRARSSPTQMTIDTPNFTTSYPEPSRGAPPVPSVPSQLPTSLYTPSVSALANKQTWDKGKYRDPPIA
ncbi:hypothetical protein BC826DRAFT_165718 [Russula brevipes]|nr:hypothetical protein BC826DRAFT_165718 [Russula brevipes]